MKLTPPQKQVLFIVLTMLAAFLAFLVSFYIAGADMER